MENRLEIEQKSKNIVREKEGRKRDRIHRKNTWIRALGEVWTRARPYSKIPVRLARENWKPSL